MTLDFCLWSAISSTMALILLMVSMQRFLIWFFWAFWNCLAVKTAWSHAPIAASTRPTITPQKNSLVRTATTHVMDVNPDNRQHQARPHATLLACLSPRQSDFSRHRACAFAHSCSPTISD